MNELVSEVAILNAINVYSRIFGITMSALILITGGFLPITHSWLTSPPRGHTSLRMAQPVPVLNKTFAIPSTGLTFSSVHY